MPLKQEATDLLNNRFFQLVKSEIEAEYFEKWQAAETVEDREIIYTDCKAYQTLIERIEHEAGHYEPPELGVA